MNKHPDLLQANLAPDPFIPLEYGELSVPTLNQELEKLRSLKIDPESIDIKELCSKQGSAALQHATDLSQKAFLEALQGLELIPDLKTHAANIISKQEWLGVAPESAEHFVLRELFAKLNRLRFSLIQNWLQHSPDTGFSPVANLEYKHLIPAMATIDRWYIKMATEQYPIDSAERSRRGLLNEFAIVRNIDKKVVEIPFSEAYPEEIHTIVSACGKLIQELELLEPDGNSHLNQLLPRKLAYYRALKTAFQNNTSATWLAVEELFGQQIVDSSDPHHVHPMENSYLKDTILRVPEMCLRSLDPEASNEQRLADQTKARMLASLQDQKYLPSELALAESLEVLQDSSTTFCFSLGTGMEMDLRFVGQCLPNKISARKKGCISALDKHVIIEKLPLVQNATIAVFGKEAFEKFFQTVFDNPTSIIAEDTTGHELGHIVAVNQTTEDRLNNLALQGPYIEEWKATVAGAVGDLYIPYLKQQIPFSKLQDWMLRHISMACRYTQNRNKPSTRIYFRKSMMLMDLAQETGCLKYDPSTDPEYPWQPDLSETNVLDFFQKLFEQFKSVVQIYSDGTAADLEAFLGKNLKTSSFMEYVCEKIPVDQADKHSPKEIALLPTALSREKILEVLQ